MKTLINKLDQFVIKHPDKVFNAFIYLIFIIFVSMILVLMLCMFSIIFNDLI